MKMNTKMAIFVLSCDKYKDVWDEFFNLKDKYWASLANPAFFRQVRVDCGTLCWPNDIDIDPEEVWDDCVMDKSEP